MNPKQFDNLITIAKDKNLDENEIVNKLKFYEIDKIYQNYIIKFLKGYNQANKQIEVSKMDSDFKGVQVATNDDFNKIYLEEKNKRNFYVWKNISKLDIFTNKENLLYDLKKSF